MRPNVILLTIDSLRYDAVFTDSGEVKNGLPGFRRLVQRGTSFDSAWSCAGGTPSSFKSLFSGDYFWSHDGDGFGDNHPHIAMQFKQMGYETAGFHSNPFLSERFDYDRGFDHYFTEGFEDNTGDTASMSTNDILGVLETLATSHSVTTNAAKRLKSLVGRYAGIDIRGTGKPYIPAPRIQENAREWLSGRQEPVFLWIHYMDVHNPWYPHEGTVSEDMNKKDLLRTFYDANENPSEVSEMDRRKLRRAYEGSIQNFDRHLDSFLDYIEEHLEETAICLTGDHGELFGENGEYFHMRSVHESISHVPLVIDAAGVPLRERTPAATIDVHPTLVSIAGGSVDQEVDGRDLLAPLPDGRNVFVRGNDSLRVIGAEETSVYGIPLNGDLSHLSEDEKEQIVGIESTDKDLDGMETDGIEDQLEALGYK